MNTENQTHRNSRNNIKLYNTRESDKDENCKFKF